VAAIFCSWFPFQITGLRLGTGSFIRNCGSHPHDCTAIFLLPNIARPRFIRFSGVQEEQETGKGIVYEYQNPFNGKLGTGKCKKMWTPTENTENIDTHNEQDSGSRHPPSMIMIGYKPGPLRERVIRDRGNEWTSG
jgi:hypothetical protein